MMEQPFWGNFDELRRRTNSFCFYSFLLFFLIFLLEKKSGALCGFGATCDGKILCLSLAALTRQKSSSRSSSIRPSFLCTISHLKSWTNVNNFPQDQKSFSSSSRIQPHKSFLLSLCLFCCSWFQLFQVYVVTRRSIRQHVKRRSQIPEQADGVSGQDPHFPTNSLSQY